MTNRMIQAHGLVQRAKQRGELIAPACCEQCGGTGPVEAAHYDYVRPLDVRWLCKACHRRWDVAVPKPNGGLPQHRVYLRLRPDLTQRIITLALQERRTLTATVELLVERALKEASSSLTRSVEASGRQPLVKTPRWSVLQAANGEPSAVRASTPAVGSTPRQNLNSTAVSAAR